MKKLKQILIALLMCCLFIVPMTACGDTANNSNGIILKYTIDIDKDDETYGTIHIMYRPDVYLEYRYYLIWIKEDDFATYNCSKLNDLLTDETFVSHNQDTRHDIMVSQRQSEISISISTTFDDRETYRCILLYKYHTYKENGSLLNYVGMINFK